MQWLEHALQDLRFTLRGWRRNPGFVLPAAGMLALGLGANTAIFSVVSGVLLRPLPFPHPEELVQLSVSSPADPRLPATYVTYADLDNWRQSAVSLKGAATYSVFSQNLQRITLPEQVATVRADRSFFATLGVSVLLGRTFDDGDPPNVAVASFSFWKRHLGGDALAIGRKITLDGESATILGVMPEGFQFPYRSTQTDLWTLWAARFPPNARLDAVIGRLKPGVTVEAARQELSALSRRLAPGRHANVRLLSEAIGGPVRESLLVLFGAVGFVLLIACANVANLLLARAAVRRVEVAIRTALGAGRWRLIQQFSTESLLLAFVGALAGLGIGKWASYLLLNAAADQIPRAREIGFDWRVFVFLLAASLLAGLSFGTLPAIHAARGDVQRYLKTAERGSVGRGRLRDGLVIGEVTLAFVLMAGAGLLARTFLNLRSTTTGFITHGVLSLHVVVAGADEILALEQRVARIPGVRGVGFISLLPLQNSNWNGRFVITGRSGEGSAEFRYVTPGYFMVMSVPIVRGRAFSERDAANAPKVLLVNEVFVKQYLPNEDPIGHELTERGTIVGIVGDVRQSRLDHPAVPEIYYPVAQNFGQIRSLGSSMVVGSNLPADSLVGTIRLAIREVSPNQATFRVRTMDQVVDESMSGQRLYLWLLGVFAGMATLLAAAGIYSVIAYLVTLRAREIGIRMALGADAGRVVRLVLGRGGLLVGIGLVLGSIGAFALTRLLTSVLYGVTATDPTTFGTIALLLGLVGLSACAVPSRRAARVDPAVTLRAE